jgi:hypothetical protein
MDAYNDGRFKWVLPAHPGFFIIEDYEDEDGNVLLCFDVIVAWGIQEDVSRLRDGTRYLYYATPISVDLGSAEHFDQERPILVPDGQVISPMNRSWDSKEAYLEELKKKKKSGV